MKTVTVPLRRSARVDGRWRKRGEKVDVTPTLARLMAEGKNPKVDPKDLEKTLKAAAKPAPGEGKDQG